MQISDRNDDQSKLMLHNVTSADTGTYTCVSRMSNPSSLLTTSCHVQVFGKINIYLNARTGNPGENSQIKITYLPKHVSSGPSVCG